LPRGHTATGERRGMLLKIKGRRVLFVYAERPRYRKIDVDFLPKEEAEKFITKEEM
jgi:hypothetical protein